MGQPCADEDWRIRVIVTVLSICKLRMTHTTTELADSTVEKNVCSRLATTTASS